MSASSSMLNDSSTQEDESIVGKIQVRSFIEMLDDYSRSSSNVFKILSSLLDYFDVGGKTVVSKHFLKIIDKNYSKVNSFLSLLQFKLKDYTKVNKLLKSKSVDTLNWLDSMLEFMLFIPKAGPKKKSITELSKSSRNKRNGFWKKSKYKE